MSKWQISPTDLKPIDTVTNDEFLNVIFEKCHDDLPLVCSKTTHNSDWTTYPMGTVKFSPNHENYFTLASFKPIEGKWKRQKSAFSALHCIVLDDVVWKVNEENIKAQIPFDRIALQPTWIIETSKGNHQVGYLLSDPINDEVMIKALEKAILHQGITDKGASGFTTRLMRLPVGANLKREEAFETKLLYWEPSVQYSLEEWIKGFNLSLEETREADKRWETNQALVTDLSPIPANLTRVLTKLDPVDENLLETLKSQGYYKRNLGQGKHEIMCPWVHEHTDHDDSGTCYFEPSKENRGLGGFKCHHGHCQGRTISDLCKKLNIPFNPTEKRYMITYQEQFFEEVIQACEYILSETSQFFQANGKVIEVNWNSNYQQNQAREVNAADLKRTLSTLSHWQRYGKKDNLIPSNPNDQIIKALYESSTHHYLLPFKGFYRQPFFNERDELVNVQDYDFDTQYFADFDPTEYEIPERPNKEVALNALKALDEICQDFEFENPMDIMSVYSALITAVIRKKLRTAPMYHIQAHMPGAGKTYLTELIGVFATDGNLSMSSLPKNDEECEKLILSALRSNPDVIVFDNLTSDLYPYKALCSVLTASRYEGRVLGSTQTLSVDTKTLFLSSGNNVEPVNDMARRVLTIHLTSEEEHPETRQFKRPNLLNEVKTKRAFYVSLVLTILHAWILADKPQAKLIPINSYQDWTYWVRQPLYWLTGYDCAHVWLNDMKRDPEKENTARLFEFLYEHFGNNEFSVRDLMQFLCNECFNEALDGLNIPHDNKAIGRLLKRKENVIAGGFLLARSPFRRNVNHYQILKRD